MAWKQGEGFRVALNRHSTAVLLSLGGILLALCIRNYEKPARDMEFAVSSVVSVEDESGCVSGSGFILEGGEYAITAYHVVDDYAKKGKEILLRRKHRMADEVTMVKFNRHFDIALLKFKRKQPRGLRVVSETTMRQGDRVYAIGHPYGITWMVTEGIITRMAYWPPNPNGSQYMVWTDAWIENGSSGGPLINSNGDVVGLVVAFANPKIAGFASHLNLCIAGSEMLRFLDEP